MASLASLNSVKQKAEFHKSQISKGQIVKIIEKQANLILRDNQELRNIILEGIALNQENIADMLLLDEQVERVDKIVMKVNDAMETLDDKWKENVSSIHHGFELAVKDLSREIKRELAEIEKKLTKRLEVALPDKPVIRLTNPHKKLETVIRLATLRHDTMLSGPAGSGKGTASRQVAQALSLSHYYKSCSPMDTTSQWFGYMDANGNYVSSLFRKCYEEGGVFLIDELDASNAQVSVSLNAAIADGYGAFPDGIIKRHKDCVIIAAANTYGYGADRVYVGRNQLDAATLDRFAFVPFDYDEDLELKVSSNDLWTKHVQGIRKNMFAKTSQGHVMRYVVSPRASIKGGVQLAAGFKWEEVEEMVLFKGWSKQDIQMVKTS